MVLWPIRARILFELFYNLESNIKVMKIKEIISNSIQYHLKCLKDSVENMLTWGLKG